jgi:hypothetical protein
MAVLECTPWNCAELCCCCVLQLSKLHVEHWQVLSHNYGTYTCIKDPSKEITTAGVGNVRGKGVSACLLSVRSGKTCVSAVYPVNDVHSD